MKNIIKFIKDNFLGGRIRNLESEIVELRNELSKTSSQAKNAYNTSSSVSRQLSYMTNVNVDLGYKPPSQIVVIGTFKGRDYIHTFDVRNDYFQRLVEELKDRYPHSVLNKVDGSPHMVRCFKGAYNEM